MLQILTFFERYTFDESKEKLLSYIFGANVQIYAHVYLGLPANFLKRKYDKFWKILRKVVTKIKCVYFTQKNKLLN